MKNSNMRNNLTFTAVCNLVIGVISIICGVSAGVLSIVSSAKIMKVKKTLKEEI